MLEIVRVQTREVVLQSMLRQTSLGEEDLRRNDLHIIFVMRKGFRKRIARSVLNGDEKWENAFIRRCNRRRCELKVWICTGSMFWGQLGVSMPEGNWQESLWMSQEVSASVACNDEH